jgi:hypothetical protein
MSLLPGLVPAVTMTLYDSYSELKTLFTVTLVLPDHEVLEISHMPTAFMSAARKTSPDENDGKVMLLPT